MKAILSRVFVIILIIAGIGVGLAFYFGYLDWNTARTKAQVATSEIVSDAKSELGIASGGSGDPYADAATCRQNIHRIETAKRKVGQRAAGGTIGTVSWDPVVKELGGKKPVCPGGGTYTLGSFQEMTRCSIGGNGTAMDEKDDHMLRGY